MSKSIMLLGAKVLILEKGDKNMEQEMQVIPCDAALEIKETV